ncbi:MAG: heme exporter protein CcmB [Deltaproteobacteria bacterium]|nr:heme exporter protein CcmB [Deltaproteobacteria bacterium]
MSLFRQAARVAWKDLRIELRSKEIIYTMAFFGALLVIIFTVAFPRDIRVARGAAPGMLWAAIAFAGTIGLGRAFDRERENDTMRALLLSPAPRLAIFLGKAIGIFALVVLVTIICTLLLSLLLGLSFFEHPLPLVCALLLGALAFANVGTVFAATLLKVRSRDVLFPVVVYPLLVPMFIMGLYATDYLIAEKPNVAAAWEWIGFLGIYNAAFLVVSVWTFESVVIE